MRNVLLLSLVLVFPGVAGAQGGAGDSPPTKGPADADRRMTEDIEIMRRLLQRSIDNAVGLASFQGLRLRTNLSPYVTSPGLGQGSLSVYNPQTFFSGLTPAGTLTPDLNINTIYSSGFPDHYVSTARVHTSAPVEGNYLKGYGVVFTITLPRSAATAPGQTAKPASKPLSDWERTRRELLGQPVQETPTAPAATRPGLVEALLKCLAENGRHFTQLQPNDKLTIAITFRDGEAGTLDIYGNPSTDPLQYYPPAKPKEGKDKADRNSGVDGASNTVLAISALLAAQGSNAKDYEMLGDLQLKQGRAQEAIDAYKKALDLKPAQPKLNELYVKLAKAYLSVERSGNEEAYRSAVEQGIRWLQKVQEHKTAPASPAAAPRGSALPSRLTISLTKKAIDDLAKGNLSLEELRRAATIEWQRIATDSEPARDGKR